MSKPTIKEQIQELESITDLFPEYLSILKLKKAILKILIPVDESPSKGALYPVSDEFLRKIKEKSLDSERPISDYLEASIFDRNLMKNLVVEITKCISRHHPEWVKSSMLIEAVDSGMIDVYQAIEAILKEDAGWFRKLGEEYEIDPSLVLLLFETPIKPFFEDVSRRVESGLKGKWWQPFCPVCGRGSVVARIKNRKRYMTCVYCGTEYLVDLFVCTNCGNNNPTSQGFITFYEHPELELNYCEECNHYIKSIYEEGLKKKIPTGLEDILTQELDILAEKQKLERT